MASKRPPTSKTKRASALHSAAHEAIIEFLIAARESKGISQSELGRRINITQPHMSVLERNGRSLTIIELLDIISAITDGDTKEADKLIKKIHEIYQKRRR